MKTRQLATIVRRLGVPSEFEQASTGTVLQLRRVLSQAFNGRTPEALVNAYGITGREFVVLASDLGAIDRVRELDSFRDASGRYVVASATPLLEEGTGAVMGYRIYSRGRS